MDDGRCIERNLMMHPPPHATVISTQPGNPRAAFARFAFQQKQASQETALGFQVLIPELERKKFE